MVSTGFCCVVTLTMVAVFTLCKTVNGTTGISGAGDPQKYGPDTPPITDPLDARQRWPARSLKSAASAGILNWSNFGVGKVFGRETAPHITPTDHVAELFKSFTLKDVKPKGFFESEQFLEWERQVRTKFPVKAEELMLATLLKEFRHDVNGGVDAILANALKESNTNSMAKRFEDLLLGKLAAGIREQDPISKIDFVRYAHYRGDQRDELVKRMQQMTDNQGDPEWFSKLEGGLMHESETYSKQLDDYFGSIGQFESIQNVFYRLSMGKGVENDAFLLDLLARKASEIDSKKNIGEHMVEKLQKLGWNGEQIRSSLEKFDSMELPNGFRSRLLDPMLEALQ